MRNDLVNGLVRIEAGSRMRPRVVGLIVLTGVLCCGLLFGAITSKAFRGAGFNAADGEVDGKKPSAAEQTKLDAGIAKFKSGVAGTKDCAKCLEDMVTNNRLCTESGTSTAGATTLPDKAAGCDPKAEAINVSTNIINAPVEVLACALNHEWCHTNQTDFSGDFESPCYQVEIDCLKALGQDQADTPGKKRYDQMVQCLADLKKASQSPPKTEPVNAGVIEHDQGAIYSISSSFPIFHGIASGLATSFDWPLQMTIPFDIEILHNVMGGQTVAVVSGLNEPSNVGVIERLVVQNGHVLMELPPINLPLVHPFRLTSDRERATVYVLDTSGNQILRMIDTNADLVPDQMAPTPFATASGFPQLVPALGMSLNIQPPVPSLFLDFRDTRALAAIHIDDPRTVLFDNDADGDADSSLNIGWRDIVAFEPGYYRTPSAGATTVDIFAGTGVNLQVQRTDPTGANNLGVIGAGAVPVGTNELVVPLTQSLQVGQYIRTLDLDNPLLGSFPVCIVADPNPVMVASNKVSLIWGGHFPGTTVDIVYRRLNVNHFNGDFSIFLPATGGACPTSCNTTLGTYNIGCKGNPPPGRLDMWIVRTRGGVCHGTWNEGGRQSGDRDTSVVACP